ncbi:hypothetical protein RIR_jg6152.t1 [Rhizophagus irregularis DAOM 181602=DAOM 197198]|nr:hypothetical protein RIR_jg6152.t1 [Rhizophagus irregularis DAOM 181602=DAOM 197198]
MITHLLSLLYYSGYCQFNITNILHTCKTKLIFSLFIHQINLYTKLIYTLYLTVRSGHTLISVRNSINKREKKEAKKKILATLNLKSPF